MSKSKAVSEEPVVEDATPTDPIIVPDTPPVETEPTEPVTEPTPEPEADPVPEEPVVEEEPEPEPETEEPVVEPSPEPEVEERPVPEGDKPVESIPVGSVAERAVTLVSKIEDEEVRGLLMDALADKMIFTKDLDIRYRNHISNCIREMNRWIRTNIPNSASFKTFMEGINDYLLRVETQGVPSMWSEEAASAPLDEIQARKAAMAIERAVSTLSVPDEEADETRVKITLEIVAELMAYAQGVREGKIK